MADPRLQEDQSDDAKAQRLAQAKAIQDEAKALVDTFFAEASKAIGPAIQPIMDALVKAKSQAVQLPNYVQKFEGLKREIDKLTQELAAAQTKQKEMLAHPDVKAARLEAMKAQQARLAQMIATEESPEEKPEQSTTQEA